MSEVKPMLFQEINDKTILDKNNFYFLKENGVRALIHIKNNKIVGIRGRRNIPVLYLYPELETVEFPFRTAILDSEICIFDGNKSIYYNGIDRRRSRKTLDEIKRIEKEIGVLKVVVFDALKINDEILLNKPYSYRYGKLKKIKDGKHIMLAKAYKDGHQLWKKIIKEDHEGIIIRNPKGIYQLGKRADFKLKNYKPAELTVISYEENDKGIRVEGTVTLKDGTTLSKVACQFSNLDSVQEGDKLKIKYLDIIDTKDNGKRLIQPTKLSKEQYERLKEW